MRTGLRAVTAFLLIAGLPASAWDERSAVHRLIGRVVAVADGDTLTVLDDAKVQHKIRLEGIDAPEAKQAFGSRSRKALSDHTFGKDVRIEWRSKDRYGRTLGDIFVGERWINCQMVSEGYAWHFKQYSSEKKLADAEEAARQSKLGLWAEKHPIPPWEFRKAKRDASSRKPK